MRKDLFLNLQHMTRLKGIETVKDRLYFIYLHLFTTYDPIEGIKTIKKKPTAWLF